MTVIWDWNGTLLNDVELSNNLLNKLLINNEYEHNVSLKKYKDIFCFPIKEYYNSAGFNFEKHPFEDLAKQYMQMFEQDWHKCNLQPNAENVIKTLNKNNVRQAILSASPLNMLNIQTEHYKIKHLFYKILGLNDIYAQSKVSVAKDWMAQEHIDKDSTIMVGDTVHDYEVANVLGVKCVLYANGHQSIQTLKRTNAQIITNLKQIIELTK